MTAFNENFSFTAIAREASSSIAPAWPLDRSVAVNPWWPQRHERIEQTFAEQAVLTGETGLMPLTYYAEKWGTQIQPIHLEQALAELNSPFTVDQLEQWLSTPNTALPRWHTLGALMDREIPSAQGHSWPQEVLQQISQFVALYHQYPTRFDADGKNGEHLYQSWLEVVTRDKGIKTLLGVDLLPYFAQLPTSLEDMLALCEEQWAPMLQTKDGAYAYTRAALHLLSGWAGWQAWLDWQANLEQQHIDIPHTLGLTTIVLAWNYVLWQWLKHHSTSAFDSISTRIANQARSIHDDYLLAERQLAPMWVWQRALELSVHQPWVTQVQETKPATPNGRPSLQAVFCIDVRSEPMRRALEQQDQGVETLGFAGFFGLPIAYHTHDDRISRPQLPGLLAPDLVAQQTKMQPERWLRLTQLGWQHSLEKPSSNLGMIEAGGLLKLVSLFKRVILQKGSSNPINRDARHNDNWQLKRHNVPLTDDEKAELGAGILKAMGVSERLAPVFLLTGHGSETCNNHTASGLDCGACGGQTGEVNVKVLAQLLNDASVRNSMPKYGVKVPNDTVFYAAMHNTTTDDIEVYDAPSTPWMNGIASASQQARRTRLEQFEHAPTTTDVKRFFKQRATNWAQMRPEWGLCNNAGVFIAPRSLTKHIDLKGRAFLHEYDVAQDPQFEQLEKIMTAPLLVTNWINMQYYASVAVPDKYSSGNKLLHNIVGGHIGVFEGNGGDLRIGLSTQSVHDGQQYRHQPVRLSAFIQAPKEAIDQILARHQDVASLVDNQWLFIYHIDNNHHVWKRHRDGWLAQSKQMTESVN
ncbi:MAG: putative inorganic carbon transporter subunit DabA [Vibrio sp.]